MPLLFTKFSSNLLSDRELCKRYIEQIVYLGAPRSKKMIERNQYAIHNCPGDIIINWALTNALCQPSFASPGRVSMELDLLTDKMRKEYDSLTNCFFGTTPLAQQPFLLVNEEVVSERFTYLESPFRCYAEGTVAFVRQTTFAEYCFFIPGYIVKDSRKRSSSSDSLISIEKPKMVDAKYRVVHETAVSDIAKVLGEGLLSGVMGNFAVLLFNSVFPSDMANFLDDVHKEIERIVHDEITDVIIDQLNGRIYRTAAWVRNTYTSLKESGNHTDDDLTQYLMPEENDFATEVIAPLQEERFAKPGISVFMIGAGMHLAMLQELAYVDPKADPAISAWADAIKKCAKDYGDHAKSTTDAIIDERLGMISYKNEIWYDNESGYFFNEYWWYDSFDDTSSEHFMWYTDDKGGEHGDMDASEHAQGVMKKHKDAVRTDLLTKMSDPYTTVDDWFKLINQPLPV